MIEQFYLLTFKKGYIKTYGKVDIKSSAFKTYSHNKFLFAKNNLLNPPHVITYDGFDINIDIRFDYINNFKTHDYHAFINSDLIFVTKVFLETNAKGFGIYDNYISSTTFYDFILKSSTFNKCDHISLELFSKKNIQSKSFGFDN